MSQVARLERLLKDNWVITYSDGLCTFWARHPYKGSFERGSLAELLERIDPQGGCHICGEDH